MLIKLNSLMKKTNNQKGFTLVELMVVVVIIGILVAIAVPVYKSVTDRADKSAAAANARILNGSLQQYLMEDEDNEAPADVSAVKGVLVTDYISQEDWDNMKVADDADDGKIKYSGTATQGQWFSVNESYWD